MPHGSLADALNRFESKREDVHAAKSLVKEVIWRERQHKGQRETIPRKLQKQARTFFKLDPYESWVDLIILRRDKTDEPTRRTGYPFDHVGLCNPFNTFPNVCARIV